MSFSRLSRITPIQVLSDEIRVLLPSSSSSAAMSVMVVDVPPGGQVPPHSHACEEEAYFMLDGSLLLTVGERAEELEPGDFAHVPAKTIHGYANIGDGPARFLAWTIGGPIDRFFVEMSSNVREMPRDAAILMELASRFGVTMLSPA